MTPLWAGLIAMLVMMPMAAMGSFATMLGGITPVMTPMMHIVFGAIVGIVYGRIVAWAKPFGTGYDTGPLGIPTLLKIGMGSPNLGGPLTTAGGLTFIGAAQDDYLRAFETATGRLVWEARLPAGSQAGPMTYEHEGRQYAAMTATGHARFETTLGDYLVVYALPHTGPDLSSVPERAIAKLGGANSGERAP